MDQSSPTNVTTITEAAASIGTSAATVTSALAIAANADVTITNAISAANLDTIANATTGVVTATIAADTALSDATVTAVGNVGYW